MSKKNNRNSSSERGGDRRKFLKLLGAGAIAGAGLPFSAEEASATTDSPYKTTKLHGAAANTVVAAARRSEEFRQLASDLRGAYNLGTDDAQAFSVIDKSGDVTTRYSIVRFILDTTNASGITESDVAETTAEIGIKLRKGAVVASKGTVIATHANVKNMTVVATTVQSGSIQREVMEFDTSASTLTEATLSTEGDLSTQATCGCPTKCDLCEVLVNYICKNGCDIGAATICLVIGGTFWGAVCTYMAIGICQDIELSYDCDRSSRNLCRYYGYC